MPSDNENCGPCQKVASLLAGISTCETTCSNEKIPTEYPEQEEAVIPFGSELRHGSKPTKPQGLNPKA